jgi:hypothetical protein
MSAYLVFGWPGQPVMWRWFYFSRVYGHAWQIFHVNWCKQYSRFNCYIRTMSAHVCATLAIFLIWCHTNPTVTVSHSVIFVAYNTLYRLVGGKSVINSNTDGGFQQFESRNSDFRTRSIEIANHRRGGTRRCLGFRCFSRFLATDSVGGRVERLRGIESHLQHPTCAYAVSSHHPSTAEESSLR